MDAKYASTVKLGAYLQNACLQNADLRNADLRNADLWNADLWNADLRNADLRKADLRKADLRKADLRNADLRNADLRKADLRGTCLDPDLIPNGFCECFSRCGRYIVGYRTRKAGHIDKYRDGRTYTADIFSCCPVTECHPGLYVYPTAERVRREFDGEIIRVYILPKDIHYAGNKWRCRMFEVIGQA